MARNPGRSGSEADVPPDDLTGEALRAYKSFLKSEAAALLAPPRQGANSLIKEWRLFAVKEKALYVALNFFESEITLHADYWYPATEENEIRAALIQQSNSQQASAMLVTNATRRTSQYRATPPTYVRRNEFTSTDQDLIDTYGNPGYQEANPGLFITTTSPSSSE